MAFKPVPAYPLHDGTTTTYDVSVFDDNFLYLAQKWPSVKDYGAVGDGVTDDAAAINAALAAGAGFFPPGTYLCNSAINVGAADGLEIQGAGVKRVTIHFPNASAGITLTYSDVTNAPNIRGLSITVAGNSAQAALTVNGPTVTTAYSEGPIFESIVIRGQTPTTDTWAEGIKLSQVWYPNFNNIVIEGGITTLEPYTMAVGFHFTNVQAPFGRNLYAQHVITAVLEDGTSLGEGFNFSCIEFVGVNTGFNIGAGVSTPIPGVFIGNAHINASFRGIVVANHVQTTFSGLLLYKTGNTFLNWIGVVGSEVHGCTFEDIFFGGTNQAATGNGDCIALTGTSSNNIVANLGSDYFTAAGTMVILQNTTTSNIVKSDTFSPAATGGAPVVALTLVANTGTGVLNYARPINTQGAAVASANNLTLGYDGDRFHVTGNTQINLLSNQDWPPGSRFTLHFDSNPMVKNNQVASGNFKPLMLASGVDLSVTSGMEVTFEADSSAFWEVSRTATTGVYTPTLTNVTNITSSTTNQMTYLRVGDMVTVSGLLGIDPTAPSVTSNLRISLPVSSNFAAATDGAGVGASSQVFGLCGAINASPGNNAVALNFVSDGTAANNTWAVQFTYQVK